MSHYYGNEFQHMVVPIQKDIKINIYSIGESRAALLRMHCFFDWLSDDEVFKFQLHILEMTMPFSVYFRSIQSTLGRMVTLDEIGDRKKLWNEFSGTREMLSEREVLRIINTAFLRMNGF